MKTYFSVNNGFKVFAIVALMLFITASNSLAITITASGTGSWNTAGTWGAISRNGTIKTNTSNKTLTGTNTLFQTELAVGSIVKNLSGTTIGTIASIASNTSATFVANGASTNNSIAYTAQIVPFGTEDIVIGSNYTVTASSGFTAASLSLTGTANLTLSGEYDYTVTGNFTSVAGTTLTQNNDWMQKTRRLNVGGNFLLSGTYTYSVVSPLVRLYGAGSKTFKGLGLCFVLLESGDYTCAGNVSFTNQFWAMYNTTGTLHTGANSITGTTSTGNLFICKGTVTVDNGGLINTTTVYNGTSLAQSGGSYSGNGTLVISAGGTVTTTMFYNGAINSIASTATIAGTLNVTTQIINGYWGSSTPCVISINDGGLLNSTPEIINGYNTNPGTINVSNLGTITAGGMCNGKYPNGSGFSAGILNCTGNATINIHNTPTQWYCWSDFGTFNCGTSTVTFNGTGDGYILENTGSKFYKLVINKPSGNNMQALTSVHVLMDFTISSGDFGYSGVQSMNVGRNWTQTGTSNYKHSNTPVTFDGTNTTITTTSTGTIAFYDVNIADITIQASNVDINGSLTINNGKSHSTSASNYALSIGGSLTNNGTFTPGNSTITFDDVIDGNITGSTACSFYNMIINKAASTNTLTNGATSKVFTVRNDLTITQGNLILVANDCDYNIARNVYVASNGTLTHSVAWDTYSKKISVVGNFEVDGLLNPTIRSYISLSGAGSKNVRTGTNASSTFSRVTFSTGNFTATGTVRSNQECYAMNGTSGSFHTNGNLASFASTYVNIGPLYIDGAGTTLTTDSIELMNNGNVYHSAGVANYGTVKINSGSTYECSNTPSVYISKTMNNNGTLTRASSTFTFNGTNNQIIKGSAPSTFYNLTLNNTGTFGVANKISLFQPITVTGKFDPNQGILVTDNTNILTMLAGSTTNATAGTETSFVDGPMTKIGSTAFTYPTGDINGINYVWAPIGMSSPAAAGDSYTAQYFFSSPEPVAGNNYLSSMMCDVSTLDHVSGIEYWDLHQNIGSSYPDVTLYWKSGTRSDIQNITDIVVAHWESCASSEGANKWASKDGNITSGSTVSSGSVISSVPFTSYSPITFGTKNNTNPLPIELISLNANCRNNNIVIDWATASETNNNYFILESSIDAKTWRHVKTIEGGHNSLTVRNYTVVDENPNSAISYYKLTQVDYDGKSKTFDPIYVNCSSTAAEKSSVSFYPNPFVSNLTIDISNIEFEKGTIQIFDMVGKLVIEKQIENKDFDASKLNINLQSLPSGLYSVKFTTNNFTTSSKIIKDF